MLVNMKPILEKASKEGYCVAAPNVMDDRSARAIISAAERVNSPVIIDISKGGFSDEEFVRIAKVCADYAKTAKVPVAINLDHGKNYEQCVLGVVSECTSIMADRSALPFEENVATVAELAKMAHAVGKTIEAELGHVGTNVGAEKEVDTSKTMETEADIRANFTRVDEAIDYVNKTGVDCLAVAVGTVHGAYPKGVVPKIDFELINKIHNAVSVPLVVHGGSGTSLEDMAKLGPAGIAKINLMADLVEWGIRYTADYVEKYNGYEDLYHTSTAVMRKFIDAFYQGFEDKLVEYMKVLGSENKA